MNSSFILHVCKIQNGDLSEENTLHQFKTTRETRLQDRSDSAPIVCSRPARGQGAGGAQPWAPTGQHQLVPRIDKINIK